LGTVYADVRRGKALAAVLSQAAITDASGNPVDIDSLIDSTTPGHAMAAG
jgi:trigger factor